MSLAIRCGRLIDGRGGDPVEGVTLLVDDGGSIERIGPKVRPPADARLVDATGLTAMPGMVDCHVHLVTRAGRTLAQRLATPYSLAVAEGYKNAERVLRAGFTSIRDLSGLPLGGKLALERGLFPGPRLRIAVAALSQTAGHGDLTTASGVCTEVADPEHPRTVVDGPGEIRRATRQLIRAGADVVKIYTSGGVMSDHGEPETTGFTPEEIAIAVQEAHAARRPVAAHAISRDGIRNAVAAGVDTIEHGMYLDEEVVDRMRERGTVLVPTLLAPVWIQRRAERNPGSVPEHMLASVHRVIDAHAESFALAVRSGVRIAFGTDTGVVPHGAAAEELEWMVRGGMTPMQALVAATRTAAEVAGFAGQTGTLEAGKRADVLLVDGDPAGDVAVLQDPARLRAVMKDGRFEVEEL